MSKRHHSGFQNIWRIPNLRTVLARVTAGFEVTKFWTLLFLSVGIPAFATTYSVKAGSSAAAIQSIVNMAGSAAGNTVAFASGTYSLAATLALPCSNGTIYTGPGVGIVTQRNLPTAVLSSTVGTNYAMATDSNGSSFTANQGCTIQYLRFSGTQGGVFVNYPASGITIQENAFDNNNPPQGGDTSQANIWIDGDNTYFAPESGVEHVSVVWNTFFNNCAAIRAVAWPDSGGGCAATWVNAYNNYLTWSDNTVNLTEEGLKLSEPQDPGMASLNTDVENNNMQGNSRIMIESQQDTNGISIYSHNSFYQPFNPSYNSFELSIPEWTASVSPTHTANDNVFIGNVPVTIGGSGAHYGIGVELWGAGSIATNNLFQGGNGADTCDAGWGCSGWGIAVGGTFTNATITGNYFSGFDVWAGTANNLSNAVSYEESASASNAGIVLSPNTVVQTSAAIPTAAPAIAVDGTTVTLRDSDTNHGLSIFYTTDGTTPAIFPTGGSAGSSQVYSKPFTMAAGTTIKAIASWGQGANQGIAFPSFGYVPSTVVTATVSAAARSLVGGYLGNKENASTMQTGSTLQFTAYGVYSDGSTGVLPDAQGNKVTAWSTSNHKVGVISMGGHVTAMGAGTVNVGAMIGSVVASPWGVTVTPATPPASAPAAIAAPAIQAAPAAVPAAAATELPAAVPAVAPAMQAGAVPATQGALGVPATGLTPASPAPASPIPAGPGPAQADAFIGPFWRLVTPAGGSASISNSHLFLGVPGGGNHDPLQGSNQAVRVVQAIGNAGFRCCHQDRFPPVCERYKYQPGSDGALR